MAALKVTDSSDISELQIIKLKHELTGATMYLVIPDGLVVESIIDKKGESAGELLRQLSANESDKIEKGVGPIADELEGTEDWGKDVKFEGLSDEFIEDEPLISTKSSKGRKSLGVKKVNSSASADPKKSIDDDLDEFATNDSIMGDIFPDEGGTSASSKVNVADLMDMLDDEETDLDDDLLDFVSEQGTL